MNKFNIVGLFCEDLRDEKDDVVTLLGIIPDDVQVMSAREDSAKNKTIATRILSKLCLYVRINFDPTYNLPEPSLRLVMADGAVLPLGSVDLETVKKSKDAAIKLGLPLAGVLMKVAISGFQPKLGLLKAEVILGDDVHLAAALSFRAPEGVPTSSSAAH